ncbi:MAG: glycosyltransferase family 4 protein [Kiritimatiellia bacterium]|jgi:glycosyltransferase involved in cell wall biosynthesis|nr:glycosyltransferase family 4 protein [Kiritimatiellia bacterium]MDP6810700.1 glycosyltransferase family 4 protein [Kiritimatiellia bacterium]MDP7023313.1 glycosyltransferase family 4 protein [Kiritimatiellia bacterium]
MTAQRPTAIHQFVAGFSNGDAISNEARVLRDCFRGWGLSSEIFCETKRILPELRKDAHDISTCNPAPSDVVLLHLSIGSPVNEAFRALACRKVLLYHNVTPPEYFRAINPQTADSLARGRDQVRALAGVADINLADSQFNADELEAFGYTDVHVLPLVLDLDRLVTSPDRRVSRQFNDGRTNILFVGRCVANKCIEDLIGTIAVYTQSVDRNARLIQVGSYAGSEPYYAFLLARCRELGLDAEVSLAGSVTQAQLNAYFEVADVFLSMSDHEGFCIPLLEAMVHDLPVIAHGAAAVPETLDGAGIIFREKNFELVAETIGRVVSDAPLRNAIVEKQRERLARYRSRDLQAELRQHFAPLLR